jgi:hypothetical protein
VNSSSKPGAQRPRETVAFARKRPNSLFGVKVVGSFLPGLTRKAFEKYGFSTATLITDWAAIAGAELAACSVPERLKWPHRPGRTEEDAAPHARGDAKARQGATLVLRVDGARALDVQYKTGQIIERINAYFGYAAVAQLRIVQAPVSAMARAVPPAASKPAAALTQEVAHVADPGLRDALARLGANIQSSVRPR